MKEKYCKFNIKMNIWDIIDKLNNVKEYYTSLIKEYFYNDFLYI